MPREYEEIKQNVKKSHPDWQDDKIASSAAKIFGSVFSTNPQHAEELEHEGKWEDYKKSHSKADKKEITNYFSFVNGVELKEQEGNMFVEGFISDPEEDIGHDFLQDQQSLVNKLNAGDAVATKLSFRHDWMQTPKNGGLEQVVPFGSMVGKAELRDNPISGKKAAWARYKLNPQYPGFADKVSQIKEGHISGFSIEYEVLPGGARYEQIGNVRRRYIQNYRLLGNGVAARPMQPNAVMTGFYAKEYEYVHKSDSSLDSETASEEAKEEKENNAHGSAAARQESAMKNSQGGNIMEGKEAELLKQLDELKAQNKELLENQKSLVGMKEDYEAFKKEASKNVLANAQMKEAQAKEIEAKEAEAKEYQAALAEYKEKPTWEGAKEMIRRSGGLSNCG